VESGDRALLLDGGHSLGSRISCSLGLGDVAHLQHNNARVGSHNSGGGSMVRFGKLLEFRALGVDIPILHSESSQFSDFAPESTLWM